MGCGWLHEFRQALLREFWGKVSYELKLESVGFQFLWAIHSSFNTFSLLLSGAPVGPWSPWAAVVKQMLKSVLFKADTSRGSWAKVWPHVFWPACKVPSWKVCAWSLKASMEAFLVIYRLSHVTGHWLSDEFWVEMLQDFVGKARYELSIEFVGFQFPWCIFEYFQHISLTPSCWPTSTVGCYRTALVEVCTH